LALKQKCLPTLLSLMMMYYNLNYFIKKSKHRNGPCSANERMFTLLGLFILFLLKEPNLYLAVM